LKRLANIFAGAKQRTSKTILTPTDGIENTAPHRVQTTVSPPRVTGTDAEEKISPAKHIITLNTKFTSQAKKHLQDV
jgi:hypothetical protein